MRVNEVMALKLKLNSAKDRWRHSSSAFALHVMGLDLRLGPT